MGDSFKTWDGPHFGDFTNNSIVLEFSPQFHFLQNIQDGLLITFICIALLILVPQAYVYIQVWNVHNQKKNLLEIFMSITSRMHKIFTLASRIVSQLVCSSLEFVKVAHVNFTLFWNLYAWLNVGCIGNELVCFVYTSCNTLHNSLVVFIMWA